MPDTIQFKNGNQIINRYTANGVKQRADYYTALTQELLPIGGVCQWVNRPSDVVHTRTDYSGNIEYETGQSGVTTLSRVHNPEGYRGSDGMYYFYIKDYQGNICSVWRWDNTYVQTTQYYADGLPKNTSTNAAVQPYKYNGKEFITMHGLDTYDYGARGYYPALGRFTSVDPLAEKRYWESPYSYCGNNPINRVDPTGMIWSDQEAANAYKEREKERVLSLEKASQLISEALNSDKYTKEQKDGFQKAISGIADRIVDLSQSINDIDQLGKDQEYTYVINDKQGGNTGNVTKRDDGKISINAPTTGLFFHEIKHVCQSLDSKELKFVKGELQNAGTTTESMGDNEVKAYQAQFSFNGYMPGRKGLYSPKEITFDLVGSMLDTQGKLLYPYMNQSK